ncbi:tetratricopeptide repeat protein [Streptomyces glaucus]|uniref:NB-ARC domain-containing protein n=1 Tax=Streptomyces glaucus TaxID=284029 RepID=A0ABN3J9K4_9ACTN
MERQVRGDEESGAAVSGELLPHDDTTDRVGASIGLRPLAADLGPERRALAIELRRSFTVLGLSVRAYAASRHHSASSVSRYLSGETVAPDHFVATLMDDVGRKLGRPISVQARARTTDLQRAALRATDSRSWKVQDLEDRLAAALQDAQIARTQADTVTTLLHLERERAAGLEAERQELAVAVAAHQAEGTEVEVLRAEQHRVRAERDALLRRVADLEAALEAAEQCVARTERRCAQLERELLAADAEAAAGEDRERERQEAEFARMRDEVARLRAAAVRDREAAPAAPYATGRGPETAPAVTIVNGDPELTDDLTGDDVQAHVQALLDRSGQGASRATPRVWGGVPNRNAAFTGRDALLDNTRLLLRDARVVTLYGMPGIGKTQLATEYAHRFTDEYDIVWWIPAGPGGAVGQGFAGLARALGLRAGVRFTAQVNAARDALRSGVPHRRWLLVLDGADEPDEVAGMVPEGPGHVLITSRNPKWSEHGSTLLEVCWYRRDESVSFLHHRAPQLPEGIAALLDEPRRWNRAVHALRRCSAVRTEPDDTTGRTMSLHPVVQRIVRNGIPEEERNLLAGVARRALAAADPGEPADIATWPRYADVLPHLRYADAHRGDGSDERRLVRNCLVHLRLSGQWAAGVEFGEQALQALRDRVGGDDDPAVWNLIHQYTPLLCAVGDYRRAEELDRAVAESAARVAGLQDPRYVQATARVSADLLGSGAYRDAVPELTTAAETFARLFGEADLRTADARLRLAVAFRVLGDYGRALRLDGECVDVYRRQVGRHDMSCLVAETHYAVDLRLLGQYPEATSVQRPVVDAARHLLGPDHPVTLRAEHSLGLCLLEQGDRTAAGGLVAGALRRARDTVGEQSPLALVFASSLSCFQRVHGDLDRAAELSARVVANCEAQFDAALRSSSPGAPRNQLERETLADLAALWGADDERTLAARRRARPYWNFEPQVV